MELFRQKIKLSEKIQDLEFQSLGFLFEVSITDLGVHLENKLKIYNVRLLVNKSLTHSIDVTNLLLKSNPIKVEFLILKQIFSSSKTLLLLENIDE